MIDAGQHRLWTIITTRHNLLCVGQLDITTSLTPVSALRIVTYQCSTFDHAEVMCTWCSRGSANLVEELGVESTVHWQLCGIFFNVRKGGRRGESWWRNVLLARVLFTEVPLNLNTHMRQTRTHTLTRRPTHQQNK